MPIRPFSKFIKSTNRQVKYWAYAAWTLPFLALAIISSLWYFDDPALVTKAIIGIGITFFSVSVFWWWWAIFKIKDIVQGLDNTIHGLTEVKEEIVKTRKVLEDSTSWDRDDSSR